MAEKKLWVLITKKPVAEIVAFLSAEQNLNLETPDANGRTFLHIAAMRKSDVLTTAFIERKANVNATDKAGLSPLHVAAGVGAFPVVQLLVSGGAKVFAVSRHNLTPSGLAKLDVSKAAKLIGLGTKSFNAQGRTQSSQVLDKALADLLLQHPGAFGFSNLTQYAEGDFKDAKRGYTTCDAKMFSVRIGPNYEKNKQKAPSDRAFYDIHAVEVFQSANKIFHASAAMSFPDLPHHTDEKMAGLEGVPKFFVLMYMLPNYDASMFGDKSDGASHQLMMTFALSEYGQEQLRTASTQPAQLLKRFLLADPTGDVELRARLKGIAILQNPTEIKCNGLVRSLITQRNGQPFMTGPRCHTFFKGTNYLEVDCDVHTFCYMARKGLSSLRDCVAENGDLVIGAVVEGRATEQPEQMLGCFRLKPSALSNLQSWDALCANFITEGQARAEKTQD
jgi:hypothetical protein